MTRLRVHNFTVSLDGYAAGPHQSLAEPLGEGGRQLHEWIFRTRSGRAMLGQDDGEPGVNDDMFRARTTGIGATIMGRNMFGPVRGPWPDESWRGWWGEDPPFGHDVFVLTHHPRAELAMRNGTTFHFTDAAPRDALGMAMRAARGQDVALGGGAATIRQFLAAGLVDEMHIAIAPVLLGHGERLFGHLPAEVDGYSCAGLTCSAGIAHARLARTISLNIITTCGARSPLASPPTA
jgi:dihydrofolate reductase